MKITDFLAADDVVVDLRASDKHGLLRELSRRAATTLSLEPEMVATALIAREGLGSTGMGQGAAIPHARLAQVARPLGLLARLRRPIDFDAIDGEPVDIVFLLLLPAAAQGEQLNALALVARRLRSREALALMRAAPNAKALHAAVQPEPATAPQRAPRA